jgi:hypothetical protein
MRNSKIQIISMTGNKIIEFLWWKNHPDFNKGNIEWYLSFIDSDSEGIFHKAFCHPALSCVS